MNPMHKADDLAVQRFQLLSPLLSEGLDRAKITQIKAQIAAYIIDLLL
jgi:hypothetical protein